MDLGLATALATGLGVYWVYGEKGKIAAISATITGAVLYAAYYWKLKSNPVLTATMAEENNKSKLNDHKLLSVKEIENIRNLINNPFRIEFVSDK